MAKERHIKDGESFDICIYPQNCHYNQDNRHFHHPPKVSLRAFVIHPSLHPHPQTTTDLLPVTADLFVFSRTLSRKESCNTYSFLSSLKHKDFKICSCCSVYQYFVLFYSSILLPGYNTICLTIYILMSPWVVSSFISKVATNICIQVFV